MVLQSINNPLLVLGLGLPEPAFPVVEDFTELVGAQVDCRVEVLRDQRGDVVGSDLRLPAFGVYDEPRPLVDPMDDTDRCFKDGVGVGGDCNDRSNADGAKIQPWFECRRCGYESRSAIVYGPER